MSLPDEAVGNGQERPKQHEPGMSIGQWETFRIRAVALEMALRWAANWDTMILDEVLDVAEEFEAFLRGSVEDENGTEP